MRGERATRETLLSSAPLMRLPAAVSTLQDRLASLLGCEPHTRAGVIGRMLHRSPSEVTGYWLQLVVAAGIATLGLVLGSTAVVIGAMLVAPLMGPIVSLGMGLAVGSPFLVLRAVTRVLLSVIVVVAFAAALTRLLPFQEMNDEIAARTTPTALDLATAAFCAVAGVYAAMRPSSDVATTAAGTSIGISLVPPLCVAGYGLGTASWSVAYGAALLFSTNFVAIVAVGSGAFAASGFAKVDVAAVEAETVELDEDAPYARRIAARLSRLFASRSGPWLRIVMPLALLGAVYVPLRRGLDEVAWQIRARDEVQDAIAALPRRVVESRVRVERGRVAIDIFLLGGQADASDAERALRDGLAASIGVVPRVEVVAVPDAAEFEALERALHAPPPAPKPVEPPPPPPPSVPDALARLEAAIDTRWPHEAAGSPVSIELDRVGDRPRVTVVHLGAELGAAAAEALSGVLSEDLGADVVVRTVAIPAEPITIAAGDPEAVARLASAVERARPIERLRVCASAPPVPARGREAPRDAELRGLVAAVLESHPRVDRVEGAYAARIVDGTCP